MHINFIKPLTATLFMISAFTGHAELRSVLDAPEWGGTFVTAQKDLPATEDIAPQDYVKLRKPNNLRDKNCLEKGVESIQNFEKQNHLNYVHDIETYTTQEKEVVFVVGFLNFRELLPVSRVFRRSIHCPTIR